MNTKPGDPDHNWKDGGRSSLQRWHQWGHIQNHSARYWTTLRPTSLTLIRGKSLTERAAAVVDINRRDRSKLISLMSSNRSRAPVLNIRVCHCVMSHPQRTGCKHFSTRCITVKTHWRWNGEEMKSNSVTFDPRRWQTDTTQLHDAAGNVSRPLATEPCVVNRAAHKEEETQAS